MKKLVLSTIAATLAVGVSVTSAWAAPLTYGTTDIAANQPIGAATNKARLDEIKSVVNGHDATISTQNTDINNLKGNLANGTCVGTDMVRVGSTCIDKYRQTVSPGGGCFGDGVGCTEIPTSSGVAGGGTAGMSWARAARFCANAGKRLPTPGEWIAARSLGATAGSTVIDTNTDGKAEWLDAAGTGVTAADPMQAGHAGPNLGGGSASGVAQMFVNADYNAGFAYIYFRCAR